MTIQSSAQLGCRCAIFVACLMLGSTIFGQSTYVEVKNFIIPLFEKPSPFSKVMYTSSKGVIFKSVQETNGFIQIMLLDGNQVWAKESDLQDYTGSTPPPIERMALVSVVKEETRKIPSSRPQTPTPPIRAGPEKTPDPSGSGTATSNIRRDTPLWLRETNGHRSAIVTQNALPKERSKLYNYPPNPKAAKYPVIPKGNYPDLEVDGFFEGKLSGRNYTPKDVNDPRWETIRRDPLFNKLPLDVLVGEPNFDMRFRFNIDGQVAEDLSVHYDVEQEPDFPGKYDIRVKHKETELTFYHFDANFLDGEFISVKKALDGVKLQSKADTWEAIVATGRQRSTPKPFETFGNGSKTIRLPNRSILEGSVTVWVNNSKQSQGSDYTIDYFDGTVEFNTAKTANDFIRVVYEFTNPIEDFIPVLSRKNFLGAQYLFKTAPGDKVIDITSQTSETLWPPKDPSENVRTSFELRHRAVVLGSERVILNNKQLSRNTDYFLKHRRGKLNLYNIKLKKEDKLRITYEYHHTKSHAETLIGKDSQGPYNLSQGNIIDGSVYVYLEDRLVSEVRDYTIDKEKGRLFFNYKVPYPTLISVDYDAIDTRRVSQNIQESPFQFGVTYLNEYARVQEEELVLRSPTLSVVATLNSTSTSDYQMQVSLTPILPSDNAIAILINNQAVPTQSIEVINAYNGIIEVKNVDQFITPPIGNTITANVSYSYQKGFTTRYILYGSDRAVNGKYENGNSDHNFLLVDIPVKFNSIKKIDLDTVTGRQRLEAGVEFVVDYKENSDSPGEEISIQFLRAADNPGSTLADYPGAGSTLTIFYEYTPNSAPNQGNIDQKMVGLTVERHITDKWKARAEVVGASNNFSRPRLSQTPPFETTGTGIANDTYFLGRTNLVSDSETIAIRQAVGITKVLTKDIDYTINYAKGTIRFRDIVPGPDDTITAEFDYFDSNGTTTNGANTGLKLATKVTSEYQDDRIILKGSFKNIDRDFLPISPILDPKGSRIFDTLFDWKISNGNHLATSYTHRDRLRGTDSQGADSFLRSDEIKSDGRFKLINNIFDTKVNFRLFKELQDKDNAVTTNPHLIDQSTLDLGTNISFGPDNVRTTLTRSYSKKSTDEKDNIRPVDSIQDNIAVDVRSRFTDIPVLGTITIDPSVSRLINKVDTNSTTTNSKQNRRAYGIKSTWIPFTQFTARLNYDFTNIENQVNLNTSKNVQQLKNSFFSFDYRPFLWLDTHFNQRNSESESPLLNQQGNKSQSRLFNVRKLLPYGGLVSIGAPRDHVIIKAMRGSFFKFSISDYNSKEFTGIRQNESDTKSIDYNNFEPIPGIKFSKLSYSKSTAANRNFLESATVSNNIFTSAVDKRYASLSVNPKMNILNLFSYDITIDDKDERRVNNQNAVDATTNVTTETLPVFARTQSLSFKPGKLKFNLFGNDWDLGTLTTQISESINNKTNFRKIDSFAPGAMTPATTNISQDDAFVRTREWVGNSTPFNIFNLEGRVTVTDEELHRNRNLSVQGTTFKEQKGYFTRAAWSPLPRLTTFTSYNYKRSTQWRADSLTASKATILLNRNSNNPALFRDFLNQIENSTQAGAQYQPFPYLAVRGSGTFRKINSQFLQFNQTNPDQEFIQKIGTAGAVFTPIKGFRASYDFNFKNTNGLSGRSGVLEATYAPFETRTFKVYISYKRTDTNGNDLNELDRSRSVQGSGDDIRLAIRQRNDTVQIGTLSVDITFPMDDSPYIEKFVITGEGFLKRITDRLDDVNPIPNSYEISGMQIKGTLFF